MSFNIMNNIDYKVGIYIRLSKEDEEKEKYSESESIQNQRTLLMQYIKENKLNFISEYVDDGVSGTSFDRPAFNKMIEDIEQGKINMIITKDLSRLGRNYVQSGYYTETYFPEHNVRYIAILDNIDTGLDSANNDIAPFKSILNEMYAKDTSKKINSVLQSKRKQGEYLGTAPYGYKKDPENKYHLIKDEEAAKVVKTIFRMFLEGYGTMQIADYLSEQKIPIPSDYNKRNRGTKSITYGLWAQSTVRFILSNEVYTGTVIQGKRKKISFKSKKFVDVPEEDWIRVPNMHEAIVSQEDYQRARRIIEDTKGSRVVENDYLFKGLLRCYDCKGYIGIRSPDKNGNIYGRCQRYGRYGKFDVCSPHNFNYQVFEESMIVVLREICKEYSNKKKLEEIAKKSKSKEDKKLDLENKIENYKTQIKKETRKLELLYEDRLAEIITVENYIENANRIKNDAHDLQKRIKELEKELNGEDKQIDKNEKLNNLVDEFLNMEKPNKEIIREFIERIEIHSDKQVDIYFNFKPLQELNDNLEKFICAKKEYERKAV
ncbi:MAG: recombinase family protein [Clostridia bacterium]|nr:recombinase family protein [Clostridia bacterium]MBQ9658062.1 recombinase family protein [Clostridia bacterium]